MQEILDYLKNHPIKHYKDGFYYFMDCKNIIDALRGVALITVATIEVVPGPLLIAGKACFVHAIVMIHRPIESAGTIDPQDVCE